MRTNVQPVLDRARVWSAAIVGASFLSFIVSTGAQAREPESRATLRFLKGWRLEQHGALRPGGQLTVEYDLDRLPQCFGSTYQGLPAWTTEAFVRFKPNNDISVGGLNSTSGTTVHSLSYTVDIPENATGAALWFRTKGRNCDSVYDSNYGRNYDFEVRRAPLPAIVSAGRWKGAFQRCDALKDAGAVETLSRDALLDGCRAIQAEVELDATAEFSEVSPHEIQAQAEVTVNGRPRAPVWLDAVDVDGRNYTFRWTVPRDIIRSAQDGKIEYTFRFSTDGVHWTRIGQGQGPDGGTPRTLVIE